MITRDQKQLIEVTIKGDAQGEKIMSTMMDTRRERQRQKMQNIHCITLMMVEHGNCMI